MSTMPRARLIAPFMLLLAACVLVALGAPRLADAAPATPCAGVLHTDPTNDVKAEEEGQLPVVSGSQKGQPNEELETFFLNTKGGVVTANIQIAKLDKTLPTGFNSGDGGIYYYAYWSFGGATHFVKAVNADGATITYGYGRVVEGGYITDGDTTGDFQEGPHGTVSIVIPADIGGKPGDTLGKIFATAESIEGADDFAGFNHVFDASIPDDPRPSPSEPNGTDYVVKECPAGGGGGTTASPTPGSTSGSATPTPTSGGGGTTPGSSSGPGAFPFKVPSSLGSAKKASKAKALKFKGTATADIENLRLALKPAKGGVAIASTTIKLFKKGSSTIKLKLKKKIKPGKYLLLAEGTSGGRQGGTVFKVKIKK